MLENVQLRNIRHTTKSQTNLFIMGKLKIYYVFFSLKKCSSDIFQQTYTLLKIYVLCWTIVWLKGKQKYQKMVQSLFRKLCFLWILEYGSTFYNPVAKTQITDLPPLNLSCTCRIAEIIRRFYFVALKL